MRDWLVDYHTDAGFDLPRLLNDDCFLAIKLLLNNQHCVSAMKLLMSALDTIAYLEFGDTPGSFQAWLNAYADLSFLGATADELWELRNSLLHMTNLDSRKVSAGKIRRLMFYFGHLPNGFPTEDARAKYMSIWKLIECVDEAFAKYCESFNNNAAKFEIFVARYDKIVSDKRYVELRK